MLNYILTRAHQEMRYPNVTSCLYSCYSISMCFRGYM